MRFLDLIQLILENLNRRKGRVLLTAVGVTIGTAAVVILVSLGVGLQKNFTSQLGGIGPLTQISVYPNYGEGGPRMVYSRWWRRRWRWWGPVTQMQADHSSNTQRSGSHSRSRQCYSS